MHRLKTYITKPTIQSSNVTISFPGFGTAFSSVIPPETVPLLRIDVMCGILTSTGIDPFNSNSTDKIETALILVGLYTETLFYIFFLCKMATI